MIINRIYETQKSSVAVACFLPGRAKDLSAPLYEESDPEIFLHSATALSGPGPPHFPDFTTTL
jgi:hypothetical protein